MSISVMVAPANGMTAVVAVEAKDKKGNWSPDSVATVKAGETVTLVLGSGQRLVAEGK